IAGPPATQIDVTGSPTSVVLTTLLSGSITDLNIEFLISVTGPSSSIVHAEQWSVTLIHDGISVLLKPDNQMHTVFGSTWDVTWDDQAAGPLTDATSFVNGTYTPSQPLSAFDGVDLAGSWTLRFNTTSGIDRDNNLDSWRIFGTTADATG